MANKTGPRFGRMLARMKLPYSLVVALLIALVPLRTAAADDTLRTRVRAFRAANEARILRELTDFLTIPNVAADDANIRRNAAQLVRMLGTRGIKARLLESPAGGPPAVYGELRTPGARRTVVMYAHYDGQPVNPAEWASDPWTPVLRRGGLSGEVMPLPAPGQPGQQIDPEARIYARSASDDKAPIVAFLVALDALRAAGIKPSVNLKFFFEGEEEDGSQHLGPLLARHARLLAADGWIFCDGPRHASGAFQVVLGVRGIVGVTMTTFGPARQLHSGHYGNWAPNPISLLVDLLASMRTADGRVTIAGLFDDVAPPTAEERAAVAALPDGDAALRQSLALAESEGKGARLAERLLLPAVNFTGIRAGNVGADAVNAIPAEASASIDLRLVPRQTPERVRALVEEHVRKQGFTIVHDRPSDDVRRKHARLVQLTWTDGYAPLRTPIQHPFAQAILRVVEEGSGQRPLVVPTFGGSLPLDRFATHLGKPLVIVPMANSDNNQHAANENLRVQNLWDAIELYATIFVRLGPLWR
jgi:acetylornithine deacetylase/succinyl-diaminopimelate desuccinylase-like protein